MGGTPRTSLIMPNQRYHQLSASGTVSEVPGPSPSSSLCPCSLGNGSFILRFQLWVTQYPLFFFSFLQKYFSFVQSLSRVRLFVTPWTAAHQASLSITNSQSLLKLTSIKLVMPSNHLILCCPLFPLPSIFPSIRVFCNESVLHGRWPKLLNQFLILNSLC